MSINLYLVLSLTIADSGCARTAWVWRASPSLKPRLPNVVERPRNEIGAPSSGNLISQNGKDGLYLICDVKGTTVEANTISDNAANGVNLMGTRGLTIGGTTSGATNTITTNQAFDLLAKGLCSGTVVQGNVIQ